MFGPNDTGKVFIEQIQILFRKYRGVTLLKKNKVYLFIQDWPTNGSLTLRGLENKVKATRFIVDLLVNLVFELVGDVNNIGVPAKAPDIPIAVIVLEIERSKEVEPAVVKQDSTGEIDLDCFTAVTHGKAKNLIIFHSLQDEFTMRWWYWQFNSNKVSLNLNLFHIIQQ